MNNKKYDNPVSIRFSKNDHELVAYIEEVGGPMKAFRKLFEYFKEDNNQINDDLRKLLDENSEMIYKRFETKIESERKRIISQLNNVNIGSNSTDFGEVKEEFKKDTSVKKLISNLIFDDDD